MHQIPLLKIAKKISVIFIIIVGIVSSATTVYAAEEQIKKYDVDIRVDKTGYTDITETIHYDFGTNQKRGIFRNIPTAYKNNDGTWYIPRFTVQSITDETEKAYQYQTTSLGAQMNIRIGDPNVYLTGEKTYIIKYRAEGIISYFASSTELYWNAIGTEWTVPILENSVRVTTPGGFTSSTCYTGERFSTSTACTISPQRKNIIQFSYPEALSSGEGITIVVGMPTSSVDKVDLSQFTVPSESNEFRSLNYDSPSPWVWTLPIGTFILCFYIWWRFGREPKGRGTIVPEYEPPRELSPIQVGTLIDGFTDNRDISALIINLAVRGFIKIKEENSDYLLIRLKPFDQLHITYETKLVSGLFNGKDKVELSGLKYKFHETAQKIKQDVQQEMVAFGYLETKPHKLVGKFGCLGWLVVTGIMVTLGVLEVFDAAELILAWIISSVLVAIFSFPMARYFTKLGSETRESIKGFKLFLSVTEKDRLKFHNAPEKKPELFEKFLPYAMVLGVEREWATQFEGLYDRMPSWYEGQFTNGFSGRFFVQHLESFSSTSGSVLTSRMMTTSSSSFGSPSRSSGFSGGSSGGGFGGGGGGSW